MTKVNLKYNDPTSELHALLLSRVHFSLGIRNRSQIHVFLVYDGFHSHHTVDPWKDTHSHRCTPSAMVHGSTRPFSSRTSRVVVSQGSVRQGLFTFLTGKWCGSLPLSKDFFCFVISPLVFTSLIESYPTFLSSCRIFLSDLIWSYRIVSYRIVSYRIVSYRIVSYRIVSYLTLLFLIWSHLLSYLILFYYNA
jgi:hypothetical protein